MQQLLFFCFLTWAIAHSQNYCSICSDHTMCRFGPGAGRLCGRNSEAGVSRSEIEEILRVHNEYRAKVANGHENRGSPGPQPPAANMQALVWDDQLAEVAQRWANQCTFQHDKCRDDSRFPVGQNIYWGSGKTTVDWSRAVRAWYDEVAQLSAANVSSYDSDYGSTGHYSQLIWARSRYVGCGRRTFGGAYRPRGAQPLEYVLSASPRRNSAVNTTDDENLEVEEEEEAGYFGGERLDLSAGVRGAITSAQGWARNWNLRDERQLRRIARQEPGYFGGARLDPTGAMGALTRPNGKPPTASRPINSFGQTTNKPVSGNGQSIRRPAFISSNNVPQFTLPAGSYSGFIPYYPYGQHVTYSLNHQNTHGLSSDSLSESSESSNESNEDGVETITGSDVVFPATLRLSTLTSGGWVTLDYDMGRDQILICNYGPSGNSFGEPIYVTGEACSKCPVGTICRDGLCF